MLDEIYAALKESHPADRYQIKKYVAWLHFRRRIYNEFYMPVHWVGTEKEPAQLEQADTPIFDTHAGNAHWI